MGEKPRVLLRRTGYYKLKKIHLMLLGSCTEVDGKVR